MSFNRRSFLVTSLAASAAAQAGVGTSASSHTKAGGASGSGTQDEVDHFIQKQMEEKGIPGGGVTIVRGDRVLKQRVYGLQSVEFNIPADEHTLFVLASASKMFAGTVAMKLVESGKISLDASIREYLPELSAAFSAVNVAHLLSHTSGLPDPKRNPAFAPEKDRREGLDDQPMETFTAKELMEYVAPLPLLAAPGAVWKYSQFPYMLFGQIVLRVTGMPFEEFVAQSVLKPLGMNETVYGDCRAVIPHRNSLNYERGKSPLKNRMLIYDRNYWTAAGCNSTLADMAKYLRALVPGRLNTQNSLDRLWKKTVLTDGTTKDYGLGFVVSTEKMGTWVGHEGGGCCYVGWSPEHRLGVAVMFNLSATHLDGLDYQVAEMAAKMA